ncbi:MAG TPA: phage Gp37/Gp68 family protein [Candidatus Paceibacterota bacterium]|nr:phage Gp37/Gp68 family protein [Verrucomicrobiota bacterium]HSA12254.1 phage Gp37/Gp68 family protein [Candidatus Paceibacterota bacterium]
MALQSSIEWTEATWNPVTGCSKISIGCRHCYAERMARRLQATGHPHYRNGFKVALHEDALELPLRWKQSRAIFVNSMSDLFHRDVPLTFIRKVFDVMHQANWHRYQILTKRAERLAELRDKLPWGPHIWQGVTVEHPAYAHRIDLLRQTGAHIKFLSLEPLLAPMPRLKLRGINWVIVGGESGPGARPMLPEWVTDIRDQCLKAGVAFHFKQWGGVFKKRNGRKLEGRFWNDMPDAPAPAARPAQLDLVPA